MASMDALQVLKRPVEEKYRRFTGRRCAPNTAKAIEIAKEKARAPNRRETGPENRKNRAINRTLAPVSGGRIPRPSVSALTTIGQRATATSGPLRRPYALEKQGAPEAVGLRTRECHSALTAMRSSRRKRKPDSIYPRYSRLRRSWPIDASRRIALSTTVSAAFTGCHSCRPRGIGRGGGTALFDRRLITTTSRLPALRLMTKL